MIQLYQFPRIWGLPNASPFCFKVENYLRMTGLPFEVKYIHNPRRGPKGKLPFIRIENKTLGDSEIIIDYLKGKYGDVLDKNLNDEQKALSVLLDNTLSSHLYWFLLYSRWQYEPNWTIVKEAFFGQMPFYLKLFVSTIARMRTLRALYLQGAGRHHYDEILEMGFSTLDAIAALLGEKRYFHGDEVTTIDGTAFAFLANIAWTPYDDAFKTQLHKLKNILGFCDRMWSTYYPELEKPFPLVF